MKKAKKQKPKKPPKNPPKNPKEIMNIKVFFVLGVN